MMKFKYLAFCFTLFMLGSCSVNAENKKGTYALVEIPAPSLKNNLVGTKDVQEIGVYLPPSYGNSEQSYPVVYFLNGYTVEAGKYPKTNSLDNVMGNKIAREFIFIELNGYNMFRGSMYANSELTGNWEDYIIKDVISYVDNHYRTLAKRESRGIAGHSMGGGGTINISLKHPDLFSVVYAMSPAVLSKDQLINGVFSNDTLMNQIRDLSDKMANVKEEDFAATLNKELDGLEVNDEKKNVILGILAMGSAFAPDLSQPLKIAFPFERKADGTFTKLEENYKNWVAGFGNLDEKVELYKSNLLMYKFYGLDCGYNDNMSGLFESTVYFSNLLTKAKIPHSTHWYDGDHTNKVSEQLTKEVLPMMSTYLLRE